MHYSFYLNGVKAFNKHNYAEAKSLFLQAINENSEEPEIYLFLGKSYFLCDEKNEAITHLKKYIKDNQSNSEHIANISYAFDLLGQCYEEINEDDAAFTCYVTATNIHPSAASAWHNFGLLSIKSAQHHLEKNLSDSFDIFKKALSYLKKALEICSTNPMFLHSVANWYDQYIEALETVNEEEGNINRHFKLAIEYYQKALDACCEDDLALKNIITLNLTECLAQYGHHLYKTEDFVNALELYSQAIALDPNHLAAMNQIGMTLFKQNRFSEARKYFADILGKTDDPQELADAWLNIACTHRLEKSWANAENALNQAKTFAPDDPSISDEEKKLMASTSYASLIKTPQTIFSNPNSVLQSQLNTPEEKPFQFNY